VNPNVYVQRRGTHLPPARFLEDLADANVKAKVEATLNPQSFDPEYLSARLPKHVLKNQWNILKQFERVGLRMSLTCTPYYLQKPRRGTHLAWSESSAVVYANSVLRAWTNREGGPSALASAIIGKTPDYGMHRAENRQPSILVKLGTSLQNEAEFGALGIYLGQILKDEIPAIQGLAHPSNTELKQFGAALATTGMASSFCIKTAQEMNGTEDVAIDSRVIEKTVDCLSTAADAKPDLVFIGCPHCSLEEIRQIALLMDGKKVRKETELWICTSRHVKRRAEDYVKEIERRGGHVLTDMCTIVSWTDTLGIETIMTNSAKTAYYAPTLNKAGTIFAPLTQCLQRILEG